ncbi:MAG: hypothetical protein ACM3ZT_05285 [Bacillota bacterium]
MSTKEIILFLHPTFGVLACLAALWVGVETLNASQANLGRIRTVSTVTAVLLWLTWIVGGYFYVTFYAADKAIILGSNWKFAHDIFMEGKEHLFFTLLLLGTFLPFAASSPQLVTDRGAKNLVLTTSSLIVLIALAIEGAGAIISYGVRVGLTH